MNLKTILLVEDDEDIRSLCTIKIQEAFPDYKILTANNAMDGYRMARIQKLEAVWSDYKMPKVMGADFALALRETKYNTNVPILLFTGYIEEAQKFCKIKNNISFVAKEQGIDRAVAILKGMLEHDNKQTDKPFIKEKDLLKYFINATTYVFQIMCDVVDVNIKEITSLEVADQYNLSVDIIGTVAMISPKFNGMFFLGTSQATFLALVEALLEEKYLKINAENADAIAELANIIFGQVKVAINEEFKLKKVIPSIIIGNNIRFSSYRNKIYLANLNTKFGSVYLGINSVVK